MKVLIVFVKFSVLATLTHATDYCSEDLCPGADHIGCGKSDDLGEDCRGNTNFHDLSEFKDEIVKYHNEYRDEVAGGLDERLPPASRMATMVWDDELAYLAGLNAKTCLFERDQCRNTENFRFSGQSLASIATNEEMDLLGTLLRCLDMLFIENQDTTTEKLEHYTTTDTVTEHFTLMVTDRNTAVGCAAIDFETPVVFHTWVLTMKTVLLTCNYASDNIEGIPVFEFGDPTSACETGPNPDYPNLCSDQEHYDLQSLDRYL